MSSPGPAHWRLLQRLAEQPPARRIAVLGLLLILLAGLLNACGQAATPTTPPPVSRTSTPSPTTSPIPASATPRPVLNLSPIPTLSEGIWETFAPPRLTPVTPIPPPLTGLVIPDEVQVIALAGIDQPAPYQGRTDLIALLIYHPRLARASIVSIPPDFFGYIPGYTMQRMWTAFSVGGSKQLTTALEYNFGLRPNAYVVVNLDTFENFIDDLGGINVSVLENVQQYCPKVVPGVVLLDGKQTVCYLRLRLDNDETSRNRRQQEALQTIFLRLVQNGNMIRLPDLYDQYRSLVDSNLTRPQILDGIPLALKLGDPSRVGYFQLSSKVLNTWQISSEPPAEVFIPNRSAVMALMQQAVNFVTTPSPLRDIVVTLQYEMTTSPTPTSTYTMTPTTTNTPTPRPTSTATQITYTPGPTSTITLTPTPSLTPDLRTATKTFTPTISPTPTNTATVTSTPTSTPKP